MMTILLWLLILGSVVWVGVDASKHRIPVSYEKPYTLNNGAVAWALSCLILWIFLFPTYLYRRAKHLKVQGTDSTRGTFGGLAIVVLVVGAFALMAFGEIKMSTSDLQVEVEKSIRQKWAAEPTLANVRIQSFGLIHKTDNQYEGLLEVAANGQRESLVVDVVYDGKQFMWQLRQ